jgi:hypothetical protein
MTMPGPRGEECRLCYYYHDRKDEDGVCHHSTALIDNGLAQRLQTWWCENFNPHPEKAEFEWIGDEFSGHAEVKEINKTTGSQGLKTN